MDEYAVKRLGLILAAQATIEGMKVRDLLNIQEYDYPYYSEDDYTTKADELCNIVCKPGELL